MNKGVVNRKGQRKKRSFSVRYIVFVLCFCLLMTMTFFLPSVSLGISDHKMMNGKISYDFNVNTYDGRVITLEERLTRLAAELAKGEEITYIQLSEKMDNTADELCAFVNDELGKMAELGLGRYSEYFDLDVEHLIEYVKCNMIAGYSSKVWYMGWSSVANPKTEAEAYWRLVLVMDCETHKILAMSYDVSAEAFIKIAGSQKTRDRTSVDLEELACDWVNYLGFGSVVLPQEALDESNAYDAPGENETVVAGISSSFFHVGFQGEAYVMPACVCYSIPCLETYGTISYDDYGWMGFPIFLDI